MRKLAIAAAVSMSLATLSVNTHALGLGEIEMYSALNQKLDAEISILSFAPGELDGLNVQLASAEDFARAGLPMASVLSAMKFGVETRPDGVPVIKVSSDGPITEPFLSFLLQVDSPQGGNRMREFTVLLDPPLFTTGQNEIAVANQTPQSSERTVTSASSEDDLLDGIIIDLADEIGDTQDVTDAAMVTLDEQPALPAIVVTDVEFDTVFEEVQNITNSVLVGAQLASEPVEPVDDAANIVDLSVALETNAPESNTASEGSAQPENIIDLSVALESPAPDSNAIFSSEVDSTVLDSQENIVDLDSIDSQLPDTSTIELTGETDDLIDLSAVENVVADTDAAAGDEIDISGIVVTPEVTLEAIETRTVEIDAPVADAIVDQAEKIASTDGDAILGEGIDLSGIVPGDISELLSGTSTTGATVFKGDGYTVRANDTLWSIARAQKASGVSTNQMVAAIQQANPAAFINGDVNRLRDGSVLKIPADYAAVGNVPSVATIRSQQQTTAAVPVESSQETSMASVGETNAVESAAEEKTPGSSSQLDRNLDAVNKKMILAQEELTSEAAQRDELSTRVVELEDSLASMKQLITLRESELGNLQTELDTVKTDSSQMADDAEEKARLLELAQSEKNDMQADLQKLQDNIAADASKAQEMVAAKADADKNQASAEAEAQSVRLATEEDALKLQLAQLQVEKTELEKTAQSDKLELLRQSEAEKAELLADAEAERARIQAELEAEKNRITEAAAAERLRIAEQAKTERESLIASANAERDRLAAESEAMRVKLLALEEEKTRLLAEAEADKAKLAEVAQVAQEEQLRLRTQAEEEKQKFEEESTRVKDRLAALQAEASANLANANNSVDTDAQGVVASVDNATDTMAATASEGTDMVKDLAGKGTAAAGGIAGGLLALEPLQRVLGDRKKVLAAGGGVALLGLLGAWATRRRKTVATNPRDLPVDIDTTGDVAPVRTNFDNRTSPTEDVDKPRSTMGRAAVAASAAAAATGAAVASRDVVADQPPVQGQEPGRREEPAPETQPMADEATAADTAHQLTDSSLLDDTITEADVYLRYGLHGQAEDLLLTAIERAPDNAEYHLKLIENYHHQKNADGFKTAVTNYQNRFGTTGHWDRITEMGREIDSGDSLYSRAGSVDVSTGASGVAAAGVAAAASGVAANLDETIDAGAEFNVDDLAATGDFSVADDTFGVGDLDDISLDDVDLAALDDDGTLNLEEIAGNQMSGLDLGSLDLTNPDGDSTLDNLTLDDADLNSLGDVSADLPGRPDSDLDISGSYGPDSNEMETMLDLAKAYIDMGDSDSAANALRDIAANGNPAQQAEAATLLNSLK